VRRVTAEVLGAKNSSPGYKRHVRTMALELMSEGYERKRPFLWDALCAVICERHKQDAQHGEGSIAATADPYRALAILTEEVGELATAMLNLGNAGPATPDVELAAVIDNLRYEAVQIAACAVAIVEAVDGGNYP
jgi:hypothetical protein